MNSENVAEKYIHALLNITIVKDRYMIESWDDWWAAAPLAAVKTLTFISDRHDNCLVAAAGGRGIFTKSIDCSQSTTDDETRSGDGGLLNELKSDIRRLLDNQQQYFSVPNYYESFS